MLPSAPGLLGVAWRTPPCGLHSGSPPLPCPRQPKLGAHSGGIVGSQVRAIQKRSWPSPAGKVTGKARDPDGRPYSKRNVFHFPCT